MECSICLLPLKKNKLTIDCFHQFHKKCFLKWIKVHKSCPICRTKDFKIIKDDKEIVYRYNNEKKLHHNNKPAIQSKKFEVWYKHGKIHRLNGPAYINRNCEIWYKDGKIHRLDGPAYKVDNLEYWYRDNKMYSFAF